MPEPVTIIFTAQILSATFSLIAAGFGLAALSYSDKACEYNIQEQEFDQIKYASNKDE